MRSYGRCGKVRHTTLEAATEAARAARLEGHTPRFAYQCPICGGAWHLTRRKSGRAVRLSPN